MAENDLKAARGESGENADFGRASAPEDGVDASRDQPLRACATVRQTMLRNNITN
jgi:hypothetical protein